MRWVSRAGDPGGSSPGRSDRSRLLAVASGVLIGLLLPAVVLNAIDLRAFTTSTLQPAVHIDPVPTILIAAGVLAAVAVGALLAATATRRQDLSRLLRMTED